MRDLKKALTGQLTQFSALFYKMDRDKSGTIDRQEFRQAVKAMKLGAEVETVDALFDEFDADGSGEISYKEYLRYTLLDVLSHSAKRVGNLFKLWDIDSSGTIDIDEFRRAIKTIGFDAPRDAVDEVFAELDEDKSGELDYDELQQVLRTRSQNHQLHPSGGKGGGTSSSSRPSSAPMPLHKASPAKWTTQLTQHPWSKSNLLTQPQQAGNTVASAQELRYTIPLTMTLPSSANSGSRPPSPSNASSDDEASRDDTDELVAYLRLTQQREAAAKAAAEAGEAVPGGGGGAGATVAEQQAAVEAERAQLLAERGRLVQATLRKVIAASAARITEILKEFDKDGNGVVDRGEFRRAVRTLFEGQDVSAEDADIDGVFKYFDEGNKGSLPRVQLERRLRKYAGLVVEQAIDIRKVAGGKKGAVLSTAVKLDRSSGVPIPEQLRTILSANAVRVIDLFRQWDDDESGVIDFDEFAGAMHYLGFSVSRAELQELFSAFDPDGSGSIEYRELNTLLRKRAAPPTRRAPPQRGEFDRPHSASAPFMRSIAVAPSMRQAMQALDSLNVAGALPHEAVLQIDRMRQVAEKEDKMQRAWSAATLQPRYSWGPAQQGTPGVQGTPVSGQWRPINKANIRTDISVSRQAAARHQALHIVNQVAMHSVKQPSTPNLTRAPSQSVIQQVMKQAAVGGGRRQAPSLISSSSIGGGSSTATMRSKRPAPRVAPKLMLSRSVDELSQMWLQPRTFKEIKEGWKPGRKFGPY